MADTNDISGVIFKLPKKAKVLKNKHQTQRGGRDKLNPKGLLTAVLKEQRTYLRENVYAQELEAKYWHSRVKSIDRSLQQPKPPQRHKDFPVNDRCFTIALKQKLDFSEGISVSCGRLKGPGTLPRTQLITKLRKSKGRLCSEPHNWEGLPTRVFSPSKGSLFTKYSKVSLQPRPYTTERRKTVALKHAGKNLSTSVIIPGQVLLDEPVMTRPISPDSRPNTSGPNTRPASRGK